MTIEIGVIAVTSVASIMIWAYSTFITKESARDTNHHLDKRLDRIEELLTHLLQR
jgi:hypothetical protein